MMAVIAAPFTAVYNTPNKSVRQNVARRGVVLHHAAMLSLDGLRRLAMGAKQVSASAICKDDNFEGMMPDGFRPWSLSDAYWDSALRSVETCNESTNGWTISDKSHWKLAHGVAWWAQQDGFWPHRGGDPKTWTVIGHREVYTIHGGSYATACPGGMDLNLVTTRAQTLLLAGPVPNPATTPWDEYEKELNMLSLIVANDSSATPAQRWAVHGPGYWRVITSANAANGAAARFGNAASVFWNEWDNAYAAAVSSGFVPANGQDSRTTNVPVTVINA